MKKVAFMGTMDTDWRDDTFEFLRTWCTVLDNRDPRWKRAKTAEDMAPLVAQDYRMMAEADIVFLHIDRGANAWTARAEFGYALCLSEHMKKRVVVSVEPDIKRREYFRAAAMNCRNMIWTDCLDQGLETLRKLLVSS